MLPCGKGARHVCGMPYALQTRHVTTPALPHVPFVDAVERRACCRARAISLFLSVSSCPEALTLTRAYRGGACAVVCGGAGRTTTT